MNQYEQRKQEKRKALTLRANSITSTLIRLAADGHCTGNDVNYARLFREYKTIERTLKNL